MGYSPQGRSTRAAITEADVRRIRQLAGQGSNTRALADAYGLTPEAIRRIVRWDTWRWVGEEGPGFVQPAPDAAAVEASKQKFLALLAKDRTEPASHVVPPMPSLDSIMRRESEKADATAARVAEDLAQHAGSEAALLDGLLGTNGITLPITNDVEKEKKS